MLPLLFEVTPREGHVDEYRATAAALRPQLDASGGCLFIDRFRSRARRLRRAEIERDSGTHDRAEAPRHFAPAPTHWHPS